MKMSDDKFAIDEEASAKELAEMSREELEDATLELLVHGVALLNKFTLLKTSAKRAMLSCLVIGALVGYITGIMI